jgi:site-specific DNA-methyltransferase (adenine-specific)
MVLYFGDCRDILKTIPDETYDCVVTDCPYHIVTGGTRIEYVGDETAGIQNKRRKYDGKTDTRKISANPLQVMCATDLKNKWLKQNDKDNELLVREGKLFRHNEIKFEEWLPEIFRVLKSGTHCYIMINGRNLTELQQKAEKAGFKYQNLLVWKKQNATPNKYYMQQCEFILMLRKGAARNVNNMGLKNCFEIPNILGNKKHPTEQPGS